MKRARFSEEQAAYSLRLPESDAPVVGMCRQIGVSEATRPRSKEQRNLKI